VPVDRPTFFESWYRVSDLTPKLSPAVKVHRQHFRGSKWYVVQNPANDEYFRLSDAAYHFVSMLDGRRTVNQVWRICMEAFGDDAPTQGEVVDLLSRLHGANLLQGNFAPDAEELFQRHRKRRWREVKGTVRNFLFIRIPLWDPDRFLSRWVGIFGNAFTRVGLLFWTALLIAGLWAVGGRVGDLTGQAAGVLNPENLPLLYASLVIVKALHEMGHAFSCKHFGTQAGGGGEVHQMGVTFLVFTPLPFVDASSAWALRSKWQRAVVGASGMMVELAIAAVAAVLWSRTAGGTTVHAIAYNIMFVAGVSTLIFNGNPLLRYDAYYILQDVLEIPNLDSRSKAYFFYLVKRWLWGVKNSPDPSREKGEKAWLLLYVIAATACRVVVMAAIAIFLGSRFFSLGVLAAAMMIGLWVLLPLGNLLRYLATGRELERKRQRAIVTSIAGALALLVFVGLIDLPDRFRIQGVVDPLQYTEIYMKTDGFVIGFLDSGTKTEPAGPALIMAASPLLEAKRDKLLADHRRLQVERQTARVREAAAVQIMSEKIAALEDQIERTRQELADLELRSPIPGTWVAPDIDRIKGRYLNRGRRIGVVADLNNLRVRAVAGQTVAAQLISGANPEVEMRMKGQPEVEIEGRIETIIPAGQSRLPSAALGYAAGGSTQIALEDPEGRQTAEPFFEIVVAPRASDANQLKPGQTMILRFATSPKPLLVQSWKRLLQLFQRRFQV